MGTGDDTGKNAGVDWKGEILGLGQKLWNGSENRRGRGSFRSSRIFRRGKADFHC